MQDYILQYLTGSILNVDVILQHKIGGDKTEGDKSRIIDEQSTIRKAVYGIRNAVAKSAKSIGDGTGGDCSKIVEFKAYLTSLLIKPYIAFKAGCLWSKEQEYDPSWWEFGSSAQSEAESLCRTINLPDLESEIYKPIDEELAKCRKKDNVQKYVEQWIENEDNVNSDQSIAETKDAITGLMDRRFPWMDYLVVVYTELSGGDAHWVNYTVRRFR